MIKIAKVVKNSTVAFYVKLKQYRYNTMFSAFVDTLGIPLISWTQINDFHKCCGKALNS